MSIDLRQWVIDLAIALDHKIIGDRINIYVADLATLELTDAEWEIFGRDARQKFDRFPQPGQLMAMAMVISRSKGEIEPNWKTFERDGKVHARKSGGFHSVVPTAQDYQKWQSESISAGAGGSEIYLKAFNAAGGRGVPPIVAPGPDKRKSGEYKSEFKPAIEAEVDLSEIAEEL